MVNTSQSGVIAFSSMSPLKPRQFFDFNTVLNINTTAIGCAPTLWPGMPPSTAWTGSSFNGDTFALISRPTTGVAATTALAFNGLPTSTITQGTAITGAVKATSCGAAPNPPVSVSVGATDGKVNSLGSQSGTTGTNGITTPSFSFSTSAPNAPGIYTLTATATGYPTISANVTVCVNALKFTAGPTNGAAPTPGDPGTPVTMTIQATACNTTPPAGVSGVTVTVTTTQGTSTVQASGQTGSDGTVTLSLTLTQPGTYTITGHADNYSPDLTAKVTVFAGQINCEPNPPFTFGGDNGITDLSQSGYATGTRGFWNKDGMSCEILPYTFTNTILTDGMVHLAWDTTAGQYPAFTYTMTWRTEDVDSSMSTDPLSSPANYGYPIPRRASVAWTLLSDGSPDFKPALACIDTNLPAPYATLQSNISATQLSFNVVVPPTVPTYTDSNDHTTKNYPTATVPPVPFWVVVGTERMLITGVSGSTWSVTTRGTNAAEHDAPAYVMSTPLPIDPVTQLQVPMCVVNHGWMAAGFNPVTGVAQIRYFTTVFDIGDGWVTIPR